MRHFLWLAVTALSTVLLAGCATSLERFSEQATLLGASATVLKTKPFLLMAALPSRQPTQQTLRVYIEGDGNAWATSTQPSTDPTPKSMMLFKLAMSDPRPAVYLARPCQYIWSDQCSSIEWTDRRFSSSVLMSYHMALEQLKKRYNNQRFELIGYSGGGAVALLLAATRTDISSVQTLAGNVDPDAWTDLHAISPLKGSLNPVQFAKKLQFIPQRHLVGERDRIIPQAVVDSYARALPQPNCLTVISVNASHSDGWAEAWMRFRDAPVTCSWSKN